MDELFGIVFIYFFKNINYSVMFDYTIFHLKENLYSVIFTKRCRDAFQRRQF